MAEDVRIPAFPQAIHPNEATGDYVLKGTLTYDECNPESVTGEEEHLGLWTHAMTWEKYIFFRGDGLMLTSDDGVIYRYLAYYPGWWCENEEVAYKGDFGWTTTEMTGVISVYYEADYCVTGIDDEGNYTYDEHTSCEYTWDVHGFKQ